MKLTFASALAASTIYVFESGLPQPWVLLFMVSLLFYFHGWGLRFLLGADPDLARRVALFLGFAGLVDLSWSLSSHVEFLFSAMQHGFNLLMFAFTLSVAEDLSEKSRQRVFYWPIVLASGSILVLYAAGMGRYFFAPRFNAYFNDPNQMAYWALCSSAIAIVSTPRPLLRLLALVLCAAVVLLSLSRSAIIGFAFLSAGAFMASLPPSGRGRLLMLGSLPPLAILLVLVPQFLFPKVADLLGLSLGHAVDRFRAIDLWENLAKRGLLRAAEHPELALFGAGNGWHNRFGTRFEIHSTWAGVLFYYGAMGMMLFLWMVGGLLRRVGLACALMFAGTLVYGISTYGIRTPVFWIMIGVLVAAAGRRRAERSQPLAERDGSRNRRPKLVQLGSGPHASGRARLGER